MRNGKNEAAFFFSFCRRKPCACWLFVLFQVVASITILPLHILGFLLPCSPSHIPQPPSTHRFICGCSVVFINGAANDCDSEGLLPGYTYPLWWDLPCWPAREGIRVHKSHFLFIFIIFPFSPSLFPISVLIHLYFYSVITNFHSHITCIHKFKTSHFTFLHDLISTVFLCFLFTLQICSYVPSSQSVILFSYLTFPTLSFIHRLNTISFLITSVFVTYFLLPPLFVSLFFISHSPSFSLHVLTHSLSHHITSHQHFHSHYATH